jgi:hypothetical protein
VCVNKREIGIAVGEEIDFGYRMGGKNYFPKFYVPSQILGKVHYWMEEESEGE